jgi:hypothetical protein
MKKLLLVLLIILTAAFFTPASLFDGGKANAAPIAQASTSPIVPDYLPPVGGGLPPCGPQYGTAWHSASGWTYWWLDSSIGVVYFGWSSHSGWCVYSNGWKYVFTAGQ